MNYQRLLDGLRRYGRQTDYAYVSDGFRPAVRETAKYKQWKRLMHICTWKTFTEQERAILGSMAVVKVAVSLGEEVFTQTGLYQSLVGDSAVQDWEWYNTFSY